MSNDYRPRSRRTRVDTDFPRAEPLENLRPFPARSTASQPEYTFSEPVDDFQFQLAPADQTQMRPRPRTEQTYSGVPTYQQDTYYDEPAYEDVAEGKARHGHNVLRIVFEVAVVALISALGIGALSWIADRFALKFVSENYTEAPNSLHITSAIIACVTVLLFGMLYLGLDKVTGIAKELYTALTWVIVLGAVAYVVLTSLSVYAVVYLILAFGVVIPLSYIPNIVTANRYATS